MCGIVVVKRTDGKPAHKQVLKRYRKQKYRGEDGFGFVALDNAGKLAKFGRYQHEHEVKESLKQLKHEFVLFHHRYPTSTINVPESAHPILVRHTELQYDYYVTHNGVLSNSLELKDLHDKLGYSYSTELKTKYKATGGRVYYGSTEFNDSESFAIEIVRTIEGLQPMCLAEGPTAYVVLQVHKTSKRAIALYFGTNGGNPLTITRGRQGLVIASQGGTAIVDNMCYRLDLKTNETAIAGHVTMPHYVAHTPPSRAMGYNYSNYEQPREFAKDVPSYTVYDSMVAEELEEELEAVERAIKDTEADIAIAKQAGEVEEAEELLIEQLTLREERARIRYAYDSKSKIPF